MGMRRILATMLPAVALALATAACSPPPPPGVVPAVPDLPPPPPPDLAGVVLPPGFVVTADHRIYGERDGAEMVLVPAGEFRMGNDGRSISWIWCGGEEPEHVVDLDAFLVDRHPVTLGQWRRFCRSAGTPEPPPWRQPAEDLMAVADIPFARAKDYAAWAGRSLPTEAQWEKAARGTDGRLNPWGDQEREIPDRPMSVGTLPLEASPYGVLDLVGGPEEWCLDFSGSYGPARFAVEPGGPPRGDQRVLRGGANTGWWKSPRGIYLPGILEVTLFKVTTTWRRPYSATFRSSSAENAGHAFRCVRRLR